eukprot:gene9918-18520_t
MASNKDDKIWNYGTIDTSTLEIQPFQFKPLPGASPSGQDDNFDERGDATDTKVERNGNIDWRESLCCIEIPKVSSKAIDANCQCITELGGFNSVCLDIDVVITAIYQYIEDEEYIDDKPTSEYASLQIIHIAYKLAS